MSWVGSSDALRVLEIEGFCGVWVGLWGFCAVVRSKVLGVFFAGRLRIPLGRPRIRKRSRAPVRSVFCRPPSHSTIEICRARDFRVVAFSCRRALLLPARWGASAASRARGRGRAQLRAREGEGERDVVGPVAPITSLPPNASLPPIASPAHRVSRASRPSRASRLSRSVPARSASAPKRARGRRSRLHGN